LFAFFSIEGKIDMRYLTTDRVNATFLDCLFRPEEIEDGKPLVESIIVDGVIGKFGFHAGRLNKNSAVIKKLLLELPDEFFDVGGGGWAFQNLGKDKLGNSWADTHLTLEQLVCLGLAINHVEYCLPRSEWRTVVGSPYIRINRLKLKPLDVKTVNDLAEGSIELPTE
jgi:hypothetical protein